MNISLVTSLFPEVNPTYHERRFPYAQLAFIPSKKLLSVRVYIKVWNYAQGIYFLTPRKD